VKAQIVVSDTTAIIHLSRINALDLLRQLYATIVIPDAVYHELVANGPDEPGAKEAMSLRWIQRRTVKNLEAVRKLAEDLDPGESEAIVLAQEIHADLLIIDEKIGRDHARRRGLTIIGMIGVLIAAKQSGRIPLIRPYLNALISTKFKLSLALYHQALLAAGESTSAKKA
jgi:uncharacterized protein